MIATSFTAAGILGYFNYLLRQNQAALDNEISRTTSDFVSYTNKLYGELNLTKGALATTTAERDDYEAKYYFEKNLIDGLNSQINDVQGKVGTLEKLSQTDPELLKKYSKVYFLNENYVPKTFAKIDTFFTYNPKEDYLFNAQIWPHLLDLLSSSQAAGADLKVISAYRSFGSQSSLKSSYKMVYGTGANKFSADQGYSEHQLGTAVDLTTTKVGASFTGFEKTPAYQWLLDNAYKYGFILSYPADNKYYQYEPWHWRYVGVALAQKLHAENKNFYDLDQREINKYLVSFFD